MISLDSVNDTFEVIASWPRAFWVYSSRLLYASQMPRCCRVILLESWLVPSWRDGALYESSWAGNCRPMVFLRSVRLDTGPFEFMMSWLPNGLSRED